MLSLAQIHGNCGRAPHNALSRLDKSRVVSFTRNYAALHALPDPGRLQGTIRDYVLESGKTKSVYAEYSKAMEFISMTTTEPQQPCPYRLTSQLKRQYTLLNVVLYKFQWTLILSQYKSNLVAFVVDEVHCVTKWLVSLYNVSAGFISC